MGKHFLGILLAGAVIVLFTGPVVYWLFGKTVLVLYAEFALPMLSIAAYIMYLSHLDEKDKNKRV